MKKIVSTRETMETIPTTIDRVNNNMSSNLKYASASNTSSVSNFVATAVVAVSFAVFAYTVKYVIASMNID